MRRSAGACARPVAAALAVALGAALSACGPDRVEYHKRQPGSETGADSAPMVLPDGRTIVFVDRLPSEGPEAPKEGPPPGAYLLDEYGNPMSVERMREETRKAQERGNDGIPLPSAELTIRERDAAGRMVLRAAMPEHVLENFSECIREREYDALWEQLVSRDAQRMMPREQFAQWCDANRTELLAFLNRLGSGWNTPDVIADVVGGPQHQRYRLHPRLKPQFRFMRMEIVYEESGCRLHSVR